MALANCARCNGVFNKVSSPLCPACAEQEERDFQIVSEALREHPGQTVEQLAESTGVSKRTILRLIKNERIASDADLAGVKCGKCGAPAISLSTRLCQRCAAEMSRAAAQACSNTGRADDASAHKGAAEPDEDAEESVHEAVRRKTGRI
jgi:predicted DNA-binding transcriptional regulator YafY